MTGPETMEDILEPTADPAWVFGVDGYDPLRESSVELRFAISNGFLGVRGARSTTRGARWVVPARTYVAGLFDTSDADTPHRGLSRPRTGCGSASCCLAALWCTTPVMCRRIA